MPSGRPTSRCHSRPPTRWSTSSMTIQVQRLKAAATASRKMSTTGISRPASEDNGYRPRTCKFLLVFHQGLTSSVYVLDVIQQPQRARACGFGDKVGADHSQTHTQDRRPLSPPPVIQLRIFDKAGNTIPPQCVQITPRTHPSLVDFHRLILMVDLWNGDQTQQRSIVMHPGARPEPQSSQNVYPARATSQPQRFDAPPQSTFSRTLLRSGGGFVGPGPEWDGYGGF